MTKIITFKCDQCGYEITQSFGPGSSFPRLLWTIGKMEVCDICMERLAKIIYKDSLEVKADQSLT